ncbi:cysteine desulfurase family protein [Gemelliphila palaticanis]|uniref:Cysteine desulfurase n=1 Tax=Gemelliphila palaticanis TaxID=81950 RepID=A0ABX2SYA3_9BACL|nr:cysteine desulfurase family protein [Gemella palaticanis]MBF0715260.1 cysteine desulfurase [Gemella palaticanis]NYS47190.1 cysteine desulfurase [Gemella palaticanis]
MNKIYLDYAASSLKHFDLLKETISEFEEIYANPSSNHSLGKKNNVLLKNAREAIAKTINAKSEQIIFTSGGTEANNMVFNHISEIFSEGEIIISDIEHPSVKEAAYKLEKSGFKTIELSTKHTGVVSVGDIKQAINEKTVLISIMFANNETGIIQPIEEISKIIKDKNILFHSDIVQAYCKVNIDIEKLNIDFASVSAHKIGATNNFGFLYSKTSKITPLLVGGGQENGLRSGSSDPIGAVMLSKCAKRTIDNIDKLKELKLYFLEKLKEENISFKINGEADNSLPNIINIYFDNIQSQRLITYLDVNNIFISGGSACSSGNIKASKIITTIYDEDRANNSVRISIGFNNTEDMIDITIAKIKQLEDRILERGM